MDGFARQAVAHDHGLVDDGLALQSAGQDAVRALQRGDAVLAKEAGGGRPVGYVHLPQQIADMLAGEIVEEADAAVHVDNDDAALDAVYGAEQDAHVFLELLQPIVAA
ncbi:MAG: hypothetical protein Q8L94_13965 [Parvibaculum sp.]|nr:hypothetical protein [Parvibaculum sp.]MDP1628220.1 hypothetical protein [Parvibaculum sp.]MDP2148060.1 hypothetical protein [Parvibaculum sp.]MDP3330352.1 hypothetical protein [Parvibaculum sp.]